MLLEHWQNNETKSRLLLREIGQLVIPYTRKFNFKHGDGSIETVFKDDMSNSIDIIFHQHWGSNVYRYEVEFTVNGDSMQNFKTTTSHFFKIISTVIYSINSFIDIYDPDALIVDGFNKWDNRGQKNKIWLEYAKMNIKNNDYQIGQLSNGFEIRKL